MNSQIDVGDVRLRQAKADDLLDMIQIETEANPFPWSAALLAQAITRYQCVVAEEDKPFGFAVMQKVLDEATLLNLVVSNPYRKLGWGRQMLAYALQWVAYEGAENCFLEVRRSNHAAITLYESMGFNQIGIRKDYYPLKMDQNGRNKPNREDALLMALSL